MTEMPEDGLLTDEDGVTRCAWACSAPEYRAYHDSEWGFPVSDDVRLFETLSLEGFQAGLSWLTILRKREAFRQAFADFDFHRIARFSGRDVERLLGDAGIVRHRGKIEAVINNAERAVELLDAGQSIASYIWSFEPDPRTGTLHRATLAQITTTDKPKALATDLKRRGWRFVGPTTVHAFMQAAGLVNDHLDGCHAKTRVDAARTQFERP
jgi:DNA-3-methyladenine glycosylase I